MLVSSMATAVSLAAMPIAKGPACPEVDQCLEADSEAGAGEDGRGAITTRGPVRQVSRCIQGNRYVTG